MGEKERESRLTWSVGAAVSAGTCGEKNEGGGVEEGRRRKRVRDGKKSCEWRAQGDGHYVPPPHTHTPPLHGENRGAGRVNNRRHRAPKRPSTPVLLAGGETG